MGRVRTDNGRVGSVDAPGAAVEADQRYRSLVEQIPAVTYVDDGSFVPVYVSPQVRSVFGVSPEEWLADTYVWRRLLHPEDRDRAVGQFHAGVAAGVPFSLEYRIVTPDGRTVWIDERSTVIHDPAGRIALVQGVMLDVSERRRAQEALRVAEDRYRSLIERLPAIVYLAEFGIASPWPYVSPRVEKILGFTPEEWTADPEIWYRQIHPDDVDRVMGEENQSRDTGDIFVTEYRMLSKDGRVTWIRDEAEVVPGEGERPALLRGLMYDVTRQKQAEEALRRSEEEVRRLLARLVEAQEEERARIAGDIHDDSIQAMTAAGLRLQAFRHRLSDPEDLAALATLDKTVSSAIGRLRHLLFDLRPRALDEEGLAAALQAYLDQLSQQVEMECVLNNRLVDEPPPHTRTVLYRIAQEALVNVRKHAHASRAEVLLEPQAGGYLVRVRDDGRGFAPSGPEEPGHLGLSSMRERAEMAGGWWRLEARPGRGTVVEFWVPAA